MEQDNPHKLKEFRQLVCSKMVRYLELSENGKRFLVQLSMNKNNEKTRALSLSRRFKL